MKQIVAICKKIKEKPKQVLLKSKQKLKKDDYAEIQNTIKVNETAKMQILHQRKFKKFNILKQKPKPNVKTTNFTERNVLLDKSPTTARPIYAKILKDLKNPSIKTSKTNLNNSKTKKNIQKKLHSLSPTTRTCKQGNIPSRNNSNANMAKMINTNKKFMNLKKK